MSLCWVISGFSKVVDSIGSNVVEKKVELGDCDDGPSVMTAPGVELNPSVIRVSAEVDALGPEAETGLLEEGKVNG